MISATIVGAKKISVSVVFGLMMTSASAVGQTMAAGASGQDLAAAFAQIADELHSQYLIGFAPPKRDGKVHRVELRVSTRGLKPRARRSYVAPSDEP